MKEISRSATGRFPSDIPNQSNVPKTDEGQTFLSSFKAGYPEVRLSFENLEERVIRTLSIPVEQIDRNNNWFSQEAFEKAMIPLEDSNYIFPVTDKDGVVTFHEFQGVTFTHCRTTFTDSHRVSPETIQEEKS
jgi:hypothetical protein